MTKIPPKLTAERRSFDKKEIPFYARGGKWLSNKILYPLGRGMKNFFLGIKLIKIKSSDMTKKQHSKTVPSKTTHLKTPKRNKGGLGRYIFRLFMTLGAWIFGIGLLAILWFSYDLPDINRLQASSRKASVVVQAIDGSVIGTYGDLYEQAVKVSDLPPYVPQALMSIEDRRFYHHFGVDFIGLVRAAYTNYRANRIVQGGSTITQQLAKNFLQTDNKYEIHDRSLRRKIQEVILAIWLEWRFTKEQIMTMYLNRVYFGSATFGIEAAARKYFNKSAKELTVYEAAVIAGLLKAPSRYSPTGNPQRSRQRAAVVLQQMQEAGYIRSAKEHLQQQDEKIRDTKGRDPKGAHFFADWVFDQLPSLIGGYDQDLVIMTTFDPKIQAHANIATKQIMKEFGAKYRTTQMSLVSMSPDGAVRAMVGGMSYGKSQYNRVTQSLRQPGSTFKLFVYLAGLEAGFKPETYFSDHPVSIGNWTPGNFRKYKPKGEITMHRAFAESVNTVTVRIAAHIGNKRITKVARRLGITSDMLSDWSVCLGAMEVTLLELTGSLATFANQGNSVTPYGIKEIRNRKGDILYQYHPPEDVQVIETKHLDQMNQMLKETIESGTGRRAQLPCPTFGKSGSNGDRDAWFIGYTKDLVTGIWTGNDNNAPMHKDSLGGRLPAQTFAKFMTPIVEGKAPDIALMNDEFVEIQLPQEEAQIPDDGSGIVEEGTEDVDQILAEIIHDPSQEPVVSQYGDEYSQSAGFVEDSWSLPDTSAAQANMIPSGREIDDFDRPALEVGTTDLDQFIDQSLGNN